MTEITSPETRRRLDALAVEASRFLTGKLGPEPRECGYVLFRLRAAPAKIEFRGTPARAHAEYKRIMAECPEHHRYRYIYVTASSAAEARHIAGEYQDARPEGGQ